MKPETKKVIDRLEGMPKHGKSYDEQGDHGWRNPIRGDTGTLLQALVLARQPHHILELGTAYGLSGCYLASELSIGGELVTIERDSIVAAEAINNFHEAKLPVQVMVGDIIKIIPDLSGQFDFIFLDANKDGYNKQFELLRRHNLITNNCLIVADNVIDRAPEMIDFIKTMDHFGAVTIHTECGLLVARIP